MASVASASIGAPPQPVSIWDHPFFDDDELPDFDTPAEGANDVDDTTKATKDPDDTEATPLIPISSETIVPGPGILCSLKDNSIEVTGSGDTISPVVAGGGQAKEEPGPLSSTDDVNMDKTPVRVALTPSPMDDGDSDIDAQVESMKTKV